MVGAALLRRLDRCEDVDVVIAGREALDLTRQDQVEGFFADGGFDQVYVAAARVGGIQANVDFPVEFLSDNLLIANNIIAAAHATGVQKLLFLGSSCVYPRMAEQPIVEGALLSGPLEYTNEAYAIAKIAGMKLCEAYSRQFCRDYRSLMPTNLYGPGDNFDLNNGHVLPSLLRRFHEAAENGLGEVVVWGSGRPLREFMHVDDLASACLHVASLSRAAWLDVTAGSSNHLNVGTGCECSISDLVALVARVTGYRGKVVFDLARPDGTPRKLLDVSRLHSTGWQAAIGLEEGISSMYAWYLDHLRSGRPIRGRVDRGLR
jgi:GDP-L-fucose synthase